MSAIDPALEAMSLELAALTETLGARVEVASLRITDRSGQLALDPPGLASPNRACRLIRAADGWIAVNLAREDDRELAPAWLRCGEIGDVWDAIGREAASRTADDLIADAILLGLPAGRVGEVVCESLAAPRLRMAAGAAKRAAPMRVVDLSALWAGPMCGAILAATGASVVKIESERRPDPTRESTPEFFRRLNGLKQHLRLDLADPQGQARLRHEVSAADILITSARPRAFVSLGLSPQAIFAANPGLTWVAITGYGWTGAAADRVAFGDDAAAAGGLVGWTVAGEPRFLGDALADPVTGLAAAVGALHGVRAGGGVLVDAPLARSAAAAAAYCGLRRP